MFVITSEVSGLFQSWLCSAGRAARHMSSVTPVHGVLCAQVASACFCQNGSGRGADRGPAASASAGTAWCTTLAAVHQDVLCAQVASACFCQPPAAGVGLTEEACRLSISGHCLVYGSRYKPMRAVLSGRDERIVLKMLVHEETDKVCHAAWSLLPTCTQPRWA